MNIHLEHNLDTEYIILLEEIRSKVTRHRKGWGPNLYGGEQLVEQIQKSSGF